MFRIFANVRRFRWLGTASLIACLAVTACQTTRAKRPKTYPVVGRVVFKNGEPLTGGAVEFQSLADSSLTTRAEIQWNGTFSVFTLVNNKKVPGAIEGQHRVSVVPPMPQNQVIELLEPVRPIVTVEPGDNDFTIEVEKVKPRRR
jgi:hypothetical protein